jgi:AcrR family transcriptional regulator
VTQSFVRARSSEQRAARRVAILVTARGMLQQGVRVLDLSLNDLARHVGLAKSNLLRYFETRESVLLELLDREYGDWLDDLEAKLAEAPVPPAMGDRVDHIAGLVADTVSHRAVLAELLSASALILEHNVSMQVAADYKHRSIAQATRLVRLVEGVVGTLPEPSRIAVAGGVNLVVGGAWGMCRPSPGMARAYEAYPDLASLRLDYGHSVRELVAVLLTGVLHRPARGDGSDVVQRTLGG